MNIEIGIVKTIQKLSSGFMDVLMKGISLFGTVYFLIGVILVMYYFFDKRYAINFGIAAAFSIFLNLFLKTWVKRPRPYLQDSGIIQKATENGYSFASGHSLVISASSVGIIDRSRRDGKLKWWSVLLCVLACILVGFSRIYLGEHFLTDVITGLFIGAFVTPFVLKAVNKIIKDSYYKWLGLALFVVGFVFVFVFHGELFVNNQSIKTMVICGGSLGAGLGLFLEFKFVKFELSKLTSRKHVWWVGLLALLEVAILFVGLLFLPKYGIALYASSAFIGFFATYVQSIIMKKIYMRLGVYGKDN